MTERETDEFCFNCCFWWPNDDEVFSGDCRKHAPRLSGMAAPHGNATFQNPRSAMWPETLRDDWCGEHIKRPEPTIPASEWKNSPSVGH